MNERDMRRDRVERALQEVYRGPVRREAERTAGEPSEATIRRIMTRVRAAARERRDGAPGNVRFLWRFVSAGAVAAAALLLIAITDLPQEIAAANQQSPDDFVVSVLNPNLPF